jgi:prepilin peptidase CpaA
MPIHVDTIVLIRIVIAGLFTIAAVVDDLKRYKISNRLMIAGLCTGIVLIFLEAVRGGQYIEYILGGGTAFVVLFPIYLVKGIGAGDVKLLAILGGLIGVYAIGSVVLWAFIATAAVGIICIATDRGRKVFVGTRSGYQLKMHAIHFSIAVLSGEVVTLCMLVWKGGFVFE